MIKAKLDKEIKAGDSWATKVAKAELTSFQIKKYQALVVRARIKRMFCEATNMAKELPVEELRHAVDIASVTYTVHIANVTSPLCPVTNEAICREFRNFSQRNPD